MPHSGTRHSCGAESASLSKAAINIYEICGVPGAESTKMMMTIPTLEISENRETEINQVPIQCTKCIWEPQVVIAVTLERQLIVQQKLCHVFVILCSLFDSASFYFFFW